MIFYDIGLASEPEILKISGYTTKQLGLISSTVMTEEGPGVLGRNGFRRRCGNENIAMLPACAHQDERSAAASGETDLRVLSGFYKGSIAAYFQDQGAGGLASRI